MSPFNFNFLQNIRTRLGRCASSAPETSLRKSCQLHLFSISVGIGSSLIFESINEFRSSVTKYVVVEHVTIKVYVNEPTRVRVRCTIGCP